MGGGGVSNQILKWKLKKYSTTYELLLLLNKLSNREKNNKKNILHHWPTYYIFKGEREREIYVVFFVRPASGSCYNHTDPVPQEEADPGQAFQRLTATGAAQDRFHITDSDVSRDTCSSMDWFTDTVNSYISLSSRKQPSHSKTIRFSRDPRELERNKERFKRSRPS